MKRPSRRLWLILGTLGAVLAVAVFKFGPRPQELEEEE